MEHRPFPLEGIWRVGMSSRGHRHRPALLPYLIVLPLLRVSRVLAGKPLHSQPLSNLGSGELKIVFSLLC